MKKMICKIIRGNSHDWPDQVESFIHGLKPGQLVDIKICTMGPHGVFSPVLLVAAITYYDDVEY
jgi:hypothetical protein